MMKKLLFTLFMLVSSGMVMAQNTYYWTGTSGATVTLSHADWKTVTETSRVGNENNADVLVVDGKALIINATNPDNTTNYTLTLKRLELRNGADVTIRNDNITGTNPTSLNINGEALNPITKSLLVTDNSTLKIVSKATSPMNISLARGGDITNNSIVYIIGEDYDDNGTTKQASSRLSVNKSNGAVLTFSSGSSAYAQSAASAFGSSGTNATNSVVFETGTTLYFNKGNSPFSNANSDAVIDLKTGSNFIVRSISTNANFFNNRVFGNLIIENGVQYIATGSNTFASVDNLIIRGDSRLQLPANVSSFSSAITGNLTVELGSTFTVTQNNNGQTNILMNGNGSLQTIGGGGTIDNLNKFTVAANANVKLNTNLSFGSTRDIIISGILDLGNNILSTKTGSSVFSTDNGSTLITSHPNGISGNITIVGTKTFAVGTSYQFNTATTTPFISEITSAKNISVGAHIVLNKSVDISGILTLNNAKLTVPDAVDLNMTPGSSFVNSGTDGYIVAESTGLVNLKDINTTPRLIPIGTNSQYTPIILSATNSSDFAVKALQNVAASLTIPANYVAATYTINRTNGTGNFTVTLGWDVALENGGVGNFGTLADNNISLYAYDGSAYTMVSTSAADNTANTATATLTDGGTFIVGQGPNTLPVTLSAFTAQKQGNSAAIKWATSSENNNSHFNLERSVNGTDFIVIGNRKGAGTTSVEQQYNYTDFSPANGSNYYRLVQYDLDGTPTVTEPQVLNFVHSVQGLAVQASRNAEEVAFYVSSGTNGVAQVAVYAIDGKKVANAKVNVEKGNNSYTVNTPSLGRGVYTLVYQLGGESYRAKFVK